MLQRKVENALHLNTLIRKKYTGWRKKGSFHTLSTYFENVRIIVDCTEKSIQKPTNFNEEENTYLANKQYSEVLA